MGAYLVLFPYSRILVLIFLLIFVDVVEIPAIFFLAETITVLDSGLPASDVSCPRTDVVFHSDVLSQDFIPPAVVIAGDEQNRES